MWLAKPKIFILWPLTESCQLMFGANDWDVVRTTNQMQIKGTRIDDLWSLSQNRQWLWRYSLEKNRVGNRLGEGDERGCLKGNAFDDHSRMVIREDNRRTSSLIPIVKVKQRRHHREQSHPGEELVKVRNLRCPYGHASTCADPFLHIAKQNLPLAAGLNIKFPLGYNKHKIPPDHQAWMLQGP